MKTAQDSYTITIKQIVRFQERMHLEKFQCHKVFSGHTTMSGVPENPMVGTKITNLLLSCRQLYQFIV